MVSVLISDHRRQTVGCDADWEASAETARESITLVKNTNSFLPLSSATKVFVTGNCDGI
jgi:hypothetical protein